MSFHGAKVSINGQVLKDVLDVRVDLAMSATGMCDITLAASRTGGDTSSSLVPSSVRIGAAITVTGSGTDSVYSEVFAGEIVALSFEIDNDTGEFAIIRAADKSHKLWRGSARRAHANKSYGDVISAMAREIGLSPAVDGSLSSGTLEHQFQATSNGEYLRHLMERTGCYWQVRAGKLVVNKGATSPTDTTVVTYGVDLHRIRARASGVATAASAAVRGWDPKTQQVIAGSATASDVILQSGMKDHMASIEQLGGSPPAYSWHSVESSSAATAMATSMRQREVAERLQVRMERREGTNLHQLYPGAAVEVKAVGAELNGKYRIASVQHSWSRQGWRSIITTGTLAPPTLAELPVGPGTGEMSWTRTGPVLGVVSNSGDDQHVGMVKVKLGVLSDDFETGWARVVSPGAGKSKGMMAMPDVGDEVVVAFEQGDPNRPLVLGGLWSDKNTPLFTAADKYHAGGKVHTWSYVIGNGQRITISDEDDRSKQFIELAMPDNKVHLFVGVEKVELWAADGKTLEVKSGSTKMLIDAQGNLSLESKGDITVKAQKDVTIEGTNVNIKAKANFKAEGSAGAEVKGSGPSKFEAGGPLTLKGAIVQIN